MKVTIVGKGKGWLDAPFDQSPLWGITQLILHRPCDLVIDMNVYDDGRWGDEELREAIAAKQLASMNRIEYISLDNYPLTQIINKFDTDYFSSTVDYAIALALFRGFDEIDLYGVNMENGTEYQYQKAGVDFWLGVAKGSGADVRVFGEHSTALRTRDSKLYGYDIPQQIKILEGEVFV